MSALLLSALLPLACQDTAVSVYNTAPSVAITDPADGALFAPGERVGLRGIVQDGQEDPEALAVFWTSSIDGELGESQADSDGLVSLALTELSGGTHAVTLSAMDSEGKLGEETITLEVGFGSGSEGAPTLIVLGPAEGEVYTVSQTLTVVATVSDEEQPWDTLNASIISSRDGTLWTGTPASNGAITEDFQGLSVGAHQLAVTVEDADGNVVTESVNVEITEDGEPDVTIVNPPPESSWWTTDTLTFEGLVGDDLTDPEDLLVTWSSNLDGTLYSASPDSSGYTAFGGSLSAGTHVLTLEATDEDLNTASDAITLTIVDPMSYDNDGDGYAELDGDCDDGDPTAYPGAPEVCDTVDNDCNGLNNEDWWDSYDAVSGSDNDTWIDAYSVGDVDSDWPWSGDFIEISGLSMHDELDEDWFRFDVGDDLLDNANFSVKLTNLYAGGSWVLELYNEAGVLEDSASGSGSVSVRFEGSWLDTGEDKFWIRVYMLSWPGGGVCETPYSIQINA